MVASTDPGWLHNAFDTLTGIFERVGMNTNVNKTVGMMCHICQTSRVRAEEYYNQRMTGEGSSYKESQRKKVKCLECGKDLVRGSLDEHQQTQNGVTKGGSGQEGDGEGAGNDPRTYKMAFPEKAGLGT